MYDKNLVPISRYMVNSIRRAVGIIDNFNMLWKDFSKLEKSSDVNAWADALEICQKHDIALPHWVKKATQQHKHLVHLTNLELSYKEDTLVAAYDALLYCNTHRLEFPDWLKTVSQELVLKLLTGVSIGSKGRHGNPVAKYKQMARDRIRYFEVVYIRELRQPDWKHTKKTHFKNKNELSKFLSRHPDADFGTNLDDVFEIVSNSLAGSPYQGSPIAIKKSYDKMRFIFDDVQGDAEEAIGYKAISDLALEHLGLGELMQFPNNKK